MFFAGATLASRLISLSDVLNGSDWSLLKKLSLTLVFSLNRLPTYAPISLFLGDPHRLVRKNVPASIPVSRRSSNPMPRPYR